MRNEMNFMFSGIRVKNMTTACLGGKVGSLRSMASESGHIGVNRRS